MAQYGKSEYWDERYTRDPEPFDWYQRWAGLKDIICEHVKPNHLILNTGSGNSRLSEEMFEDGFTNITNVDISSVVVNSMKEKYADKQGMSYECQDVRQLGAGDGTFDVVLDKGTLDSLMCGEGSTHNTQKALLEITRVLNSNGVFICVSHGQPSYRLTYLQKADYGWSVKTQTVQKPMMGTTASSTSEEKDNLHYVYICSKASREEGA